MRTLTALALILAASACGPRQEPQNQAAPQPAATANQAGGAPKAGGHDPDRAVFGYYLGIPVNLFANAPPHIGGNGPTAPSPFVEDLVVYIAAPTSDDQAVHAPARQIPTPQGPRYLPPHEDTLTRMVHQARPADAIGYFVVAGPRASDDRVRVATDPNVTDPGQYVSGAPLAREIKVGQQWLPLNSHPVIEYGLRTGLLQLRYFDYGGLMWAEFMDEGTNEVENIRGSAFTPEPAPAR